MKRIISLLLAICLLCTPAAAMDLSEFNDVLDKLRSSEAYAKLFENEQLKEQTAQVIQRMREFTDEIASMSDEELEQTIRDVAKEYNIPEMNEEQIKFLMDLCRSFESVEKFGQTVKQYEQKVNDLGDTLKKLSDNLGTILEKLNQLLNTINNILDKIGGTEEAEPISA
jgi:uncharacterized protein YpuA (DUF1002 family)